MNPPPLPESKSAPAHYCAWGSLAAPLILIFIGLIVGAIFTPVPPAIALILAGLALVLILAGIVTGIIALCGISEHGTRGLLGPSIAGLVINGALVIYIIGMAALAHFNKIAASRQVVQNMHNDAQKMALDERQSYNSKTGITNMDLKALDLAQKDLDTAAHTLSGDDALVSQVMAHYLTNVRSGMEKYRLAAAQMRAAHILTTSNLTGIAQIEFRRKLVQDFIAANDELKDATRHAETSLRTDMNNLKISPEKIDAAMTGFDAKFLPRRDLSIQIRECDDHMGQSMLTILDVLEADWGHWHSDASNNKIYFDRATARESYQESIKTIKLMAQQQVTLQGRLVNQP